MSKMPVEWHEQSARNLARSIDLASAELERKLASLAASKERLRLRLEQIAEAKRRGMTEFDEDRLLVKRKPKVPA